MEEDKKRRISEVLPKTILKKMETTMIRIGQIGVGAWGKNLLRNFIELSDSQVVACSDTNPGVLKRINQSYPYIKTYDKAEELIRSSEVDAVVIATPSPSHAELANHSFEAGKDVFVEKPLTLSLSDAEDLLENAQKSGRILMVGHLMEYHPALLQLKDYVSRGELGNLYYIYSTRVNLGKIRNDESALWSFAPHDVSAALFLLEEEPTSVATVGQDYIQKGVEDVVFVTLWFKSGIMAHIHISWLDPHKIRKLTVVGAKKMAVFDDTQSSEPVRIYDKGVKQNFDYNSYGEALTLRMGDILIPKVDMSEPLKLECQHFIECIQNRQTPRSDGYDGFRVVRILQFAQESMKNGGRPVKL